MSDQHRRPFAALQRFARRATEAASAAEERCDLCSAPIPRQHRHLLTVTTREISCACQACTILFGNAAASNGRHRLVPDRRLYLEDFEMSDVQWEDLRVPVGMAFFFHSTPEVRIVAYYPSPMGPVESLLRLSTWEALEASNATLRSMEPDVEALLVNRARGVSEHFLVPIDECYRLVGLIRMHWRGLSGGREVWREIEGYFDGLRARSRLIRREARALAPTRSGRGGGED
jgi:hypothetical protein